MTRPHVAVVGAYGSAGVAAAEELVDEDVELTLIDDGEPGGGLCILRGCMPSKEVLSAGAHKYQARHDHRLDGVPEVDLESVVETKDDHVLGFAEHRRAAVHEMAERDNVTFHHDTAKFVDDHTIEVAGETIEADYVVLGTGSDLNVPTLPGLEAVDWMGSRDVLDATEFPDSGVVMGFGYVGVELVPYLSEAADMDLTVIEHDDRPLDDKHPAFGEEILDQYREEFGVDIRTEVYEEEVEATEDGGVRLHLTDGSSVEGDQLFLFTGRTPSFPDGIEATGLDPRRDWVQNTMQTVDDDRVFVVGDATGDNMLLHNAKEEGYAAGRNILAAERGDALETYEPMTHEVMFSGLGVFPFASLGLTETEAREQGHEVVTAQRDASSDGVFKTKDVARGTARLVVDADDGTVLGYHGIHYHADAMAKTMQVILAAGMDVREIPDRAYHPTTPEVLDGLFRDTAAQL
ncbi:dihydrolipoyl dehydrogenase family protein [Halobacterium jilantaiense]|uniref:Dihydrolipoamide dehydrogenase n=1 Tax=Halobacterium jilantaiense TaxID=355548 RepID=A0A1I0P5Z0_9EURY|nr:NAD(P)/FAD-dependent oxidoreductase [Halobacterium jilantaiense]SEW09497.1 dihydrolipoamide dehydrogenase [Halobacterium jilantaiense]